MRKLGFITILLTLFISACTSTIDFKISFDSNGGSLVEPITTDGVSSITTPKDPVKEGYTFAGWYWDNVTFRELFTVNSLLDRGITNDLTVYAKWSVDETYVPIGSVKVTFDTVGGTSVAPTYVLPGRTILIPSTTKEGYTLDGWYTSVNGGVTLDERWSFTNNSVNNDITLYAKWNINTYTITFDTMLGSTIAPRSFNYNESVVMPTQPTRTGYTFTGWDQDISSKMPAENITIKALWVINTYTLTFNTDGGNAIASITQDFNTSITIPDNPTKVGHTFVRWSQAVPNTMPASNLALSAQWEIINYSITYNLDNGINNTNNPITFNVNTSRELLDPLKTGYTFKGWFKDSSYSVSYDSIELGTTENLTLYARWQINQYTISFDSNGGTNVSPIVQDFDTDVIAPVDPTREGYTFSGWSETIPSMMPSENLTLKAQWHIKYTITFDTNGGSEVAAISQDFDTDVIVPLDPTREGYTFDQWFLDTQLLSPYTFRKMPLENITLYAKWNINKYTITFDTDGGSIIDSLTQDYQTEISVVTTKEGYTFLGWDPELPEIIPAENMTVRAQWKINQYDILFNYVFVDLIGDISLNSGESIIDLSLGSSHSAAITSSGRLFTWGFNFYGRIGDGTTRDKSLPIDITSGFNLFEGEIITRISLGSAHSAAITSAGRVFTWGFNGNGALGNGTTTNRSLPTDITSGFNLFEGEIIKTISLGSSHSSAITSAGRVFTWGTNWNSQLGDGTSTGRLTPTEITNGFGLDEGERLTSISLGDSHSSAITSAGRVFTWGFNGNGELGDNTNINRSTPTEITGGFKLVEKEFITSISLGSSRSSAITSLGRIFTWGNNNNGRLGDGTSTDRLTPTDITSRFNLGDKELISKSSLGGSHSSAITSSGRIFTWGLNGNGQLGIGSISGNRSGPTEITTVKSSLIHQESYNYTSNINSYTPLLEGYTFKGWYLDIFLKISYELSNMPARDIVLYGRWIKVQGEVLYMTLDELSGYDGKNGVNAYIAYNGVIYDVTNNPNWPNGVHRGYINAGQDVTQLFQTSGAPHSASNITNLPIVGYLEEE